MISPKAFAAGASRTESRGESQMGERRAALAEMDARNRLMVALDFPTVDAARALVGRVGAGVTFYKVGLELVMVGGLDLVRELVDQGKRVFLDLKLLDIETTIERATRAAAATGATFLTVHAQDGKTLRAANAGKRATQLKILGVTLLTNMDAEDLARQGITDTPAEVAAARAQLARANGCDGVVVSGQEAARVRAAVGPGMTIVTPGIRLPGHAVADQARVAEPTSAIAAGADYLVVGRPITAAADPARAVDEFVRAIEVALVLRRSPAQD
jgi:orotidine-5'-phosphate decarboxylase